MPKPSLAGRKRTRDLSGHDNSKAKKAALLAMKAHTQETRDLLSDMPEVAPVPKSAPKKPPRNTLDAKHAAKGLFKQYQKLEAAGTPNRLQYSRQQMQTHLLEEIKKAMLDFATNPTDAERRVSAATQLVRDHHDVTSTTRRIEKYLERACVSTDT